MQPLLKKRKWIKRKKLKSPRLRKGKKLALKKRGVKKISLNTATAQAAASYNQGYQLGYNEALENSYRSSADDENQRYNEGFKKGVYAGGDGIVDTVLPDLDLLPEITIQQIVEAGVEHLRPMQYHVLGAPEVALKIIQALDAHTPLSVVRLGDGELLTLSQEVVMSTDQVRVEGSFLAYAGVYIPDLESRDQLLQAVSLADVVGIPKIRLPNFQPLAFTVLKAYGIDYRHLQLALSTVNYSLYLEGLLPQILRGRRVLVVGNAAPGLSQVLSNSGLDVVDVITPVVGMKDIPRVMGEIASRDFDIALVGAGIAAVVIVQKIATDLGKVAIDFGHLADSIAKGEAPF